jgi:hypothetical protein
VTPSAHFIFVAVCSQLSIQKCLINKGDNDSAAYVPAKWEKRKDEAVKREQDTRTQERKGGGERGRSVCVGGKC